MIASRILTALISASMLLVAQQERISLEARSVSWAGEVDLSPGKTFRDRLKSGGDGPEMVVIPAGKFRMGDIQGKYGKEELPVHQVTFQKAFAAGKYEITFAEYDEFAKVTGRKLPEDEGWGRGRQPVMNVSWDDSVAYVKWLSEQTGKRYRLPTEAEWEYAARGGSETVYWWGNEVKQGLANCRGCGSHWDGKQAAPVGSFKPNPFGLYDTAGNVAERVQDCLHENYAGAPTDGSAWEEKNGGYCGRHMVRGGSWYRAHDWARSSHRFSINPSFISTYAGFRVVRDID